MGCARIGRGTTPPVTIKTGTDLTGWTLYVTLGHDGGQITKTGDDLTVEYAEGVTTITTTLTQEETLALPEGGMVKVQLRAVSPEGAAVGQYSLIDADTLFAVGNGTNHVTRKNAFEVRADGFVLTSPNGTRWLVSVDDTGALTTSALT